MSDFDPNRLRWGDIISLSLPNTPVTNPQTIQIVNARASGLPETWSVFLFTSLLEGTGANSVSVDYQITLGVGAGTVTFDYAMNFQAATPVPVITPWSITATGSFSLATPANTIYTMPSLVIPAKDIQIKATVNAFIATALHLQIGAWVAPRVPAPVADPGESPPRREHPWMSPGFHPEALRYK